MAIENGLIPSELVKLLNYRINQEEASSRLYYAMYEWLDNKGYFGAAKLLKNWSEEEMYHAGWARKFLESYGYLPEVGALKEPRTNFESFKDIFKMSLEHEIEISEQCNDLAVKAADLGCYYVMPLALRYVGEQTDELEKTTNWVDRIALVADDPRELMLIDREMGGYGDGPMDVCKSC